jgi:hypothetical protein
MVEDLIDFKLILFFGDMNSDGTDETPFLLATGAGVTGVSSTNVPYLKR